MKQDFNSNFAEIQLRSESGEFCSVEEAQALTHQQIILHAPIKTVYVTSKHLQNI